MFNGFRESGTYKFGKPGSNFVCQPRGYVRFMHNYGNLVYPAADYNRNRNKAALGKYDGGLYLSDQADGLPDACQHPEGVGKVFNIQVSSQLAGLYAEIGNAWNLGYELLFNPILGSYIMYFPSLPFQLGNQSQVGGNMAGGSSSGKDNSFQAGTSWFTILYLHTLSGA